MNTLTAHGRMAALCDAQFADWRLPIDPSNEQQAVASPDWPAFAATFASLSGGLDDLPDEASDEQLLELVRHGLDLFKMGIVTGQQVVDGRNAVVREVLEFGESCEEHLHHVSENN